MNEAFFIVRHGLVAGAMMTCHGPFPTEEQAMAIAPQLPPADYTIYGGAKAGKSFSIAQPILTFK